MKKYLLSLCFMFATNIYAATFAPSYISIVIDDMGDNPSIDTKVVALPGSVVCAILPHSEYAKQLATQAHLANKEIIAHVPMQSIYSDYLGKDGLKISMQQKEFERALINSLNAIPYIEGINNHMGSRLTQSAKHLQWMMQLLKLTGLFYLDSRTTPKTLALEIADLNAVPAIKRDVFLDNVVTSSAIEKQFNQLVSLSRQNGLAVAIGHPNTLTLHVLEKLLPTLESRGVKLVPLSELVDARKYAWFLTHPIDAIGFSQKYFSA